MVLRLEKRNWQAGLYSDNQPKKSWNQILELHEKDPYLKKRNDLDRNKEGPDQKKQQDLDRQEDHQAQVKDQDHIKDIGLGHGFWKIYNRTRQDYPKEQDQDRRNAQDLDQNMEQGLGRAQEKENLLQKLQNTSRQEIILRLLRLKIIKLHQGQSWTKKKKLNHVKTPLATEEAG